MPREVREAMRLRAGDVLAWETGADGTATVRLLSEDYVYLLAVEAGLSEWSSPEDEEAYRGL